MKWRSMTIGRRIAFGFGIVLLLLTITGILSYVGVGGIVINASEVIDGNKLDGELAQKEVDHLVWCKKVNALLTDDSIHELTVQTDDHQCGFGKWLYGEGRTQAEALVPTLAPLLKEIEKPHHELHASAIKIGELYRPVDLELGNFLRQSKTDHLAWAHQVKDVFVDHTLGEVKAQMDPTQCKFGKWYYGPEVAERKAKDPEFAALLAPIEDVHRKLHESAKTVDQFIKEDRQDEARAYYMKNTKVLAYQVLDLIDKVLAWNDAKVEQYEAASAVFAKETTPALEATQALIAKIRDEARRNIMTDKAMLGAAQGTKRNVTIVVLAAVVIGILLALFITRGIASVLRRATSSMDEAAAQVTAASGQVSEASQSLAEGASEQAASLEETSASLEEMSVMTKQNADNANQAKLLMDETNGVVRRATDSMRQMSQAMTDIANSGQEIGKIIKTIDEIAFQTNLLALNAAVEAARAGEAGAGFAVVADEVRNLAQRAAEAAKNTAELIEGTIGRINQGSQLASDVDTAFDEVAQSTGKAVGLVGEIASASQEQAQGIDQVSLAINQMDKVTQNNAANAEESASASEELNAQAEGMMEVVGELARMVGIAAHRGGGAISSNGHARKRIGPSSTQAIPKRLPGKKGAPAKQEIQAETLIPLDDDFESF
jgi:methyl-accepting chemotaxis protein